MREQANVNVVRETENGLEVADDAGTEAWLRDEAVPRLRKQFDTYVAEKTAEQLQARADTPESTPRAGGVALPGPHEDRLPLDVVATSTTPRRPA